MHHTCVHLILLVVLQISAFAGSRVVVDDSVVIQLVQEL
jgi:hypothetical protein